MKNIISDWNKIVWQQEKSIAGKCRKKLYSILTHNLAKQKLHIVSFDVPYPADYGGAIDVFYKIKSLANAGVDIYLHCFQYGRSRSAELEKWCAGVHYYQRNTGLQSLSFSLPYIVNSRRCDELLHNLVRIDAPVLFEGVHTCYLLSHPDLKSRTKIVRTHNIEHQYYALLATRTSNLLSKIYFLVEAKLLRRFERKLTEAQALLPISESDTTYFKGVYPQKQVVQAGGFHPFDKVVSKAGLGKYCLYHGNLSHPENIEVALFLIEQVFNDGDVPFIVAGKKPDQSIVDACAKHSNIKLLNDPSGAEMDDLIVNAQLHFMPTFQASGLKLKLLYALFSGRHVLVNETMVQGTGLSELCVVAGNHPDNLKQKILQLMTVEFSEIDIELRRSVLDVNYNNQKNAAKIMDILQA